MVRENDGSTVMTAQMVRLSDMRLGSVEILFLSTKERALSA